MAKKIFICWIIYLTYMSSCLALPMREKSSFSGDTQALENSGINPKHVVNNRIGVHRYRRVYSRNSHKFLRMYNGTIDGLGDKHDPNVKIMMESVGTQIILRSYDGSACICVDNHGTVVARPSEQARNDSACAFYHNLSPKGYTTFRSYFNPSWYLGITRHGETKPAKKTRQHQRAAHFMDMN